MSENIIPLDTMCVPSVFDSSVQAPSGRAVKPSPAARSSFQTLPLGFSTLSFFHIFENLLTRKTPDINDVLGFTRTASLKNYPSRAYHSPLRKHNLGICALRSGFLKKIQSRNPLSIGVASPV